MEISYYIEGWQQRAEQERQQNEARRQNAIHEAARIARFLSEIAGVSKVVGIGSAFEPERFGQRSDIDLVVFGLPANAYFPTLGQIMMMAKFQVDLIPYESATALLKQRVAEEGVQL